MINYATIMFLLKNLNSDITAQVLSKDMNTSKPTIDRWIHLDAPHKKPPVSFTNKACVTTFLEYKERYFDNKPEDIARTLVTLLQNNNIVDLDVDRKIAEFYQDPEGYTDAQFESFVRLLVQKASLSYAAPKAAANSRVRQMPAWENLEQLSEGVCPRSVLDLKKMGLTSMDIAKQLMSNDAALYTPEALKSNAGTCQNWSSQIEAAADNWFFLCEGKKIIGNWSITFLSPEQEEQVKTGDFGGDNFSLECVNYPLTATDKEVAIFILNISLNSGYQTKGNWDALWKSFGRRIRQLNAAGITVRDIYSGLLLEDHIDIFEKMGFKKGEENKVSSTIYHLDLTKNSLAGFSWILPDEKEDMRRFDFFQLSDDGEMSLSDQQFADLCGLLYDSDKYISKALFSSREQAKQLLPSVFASKEDSMFRLDNIFCCMDSNHRIVGMLLHKRGPLNWCADVLLRYASILDITLPETLRLIEKQYFSLYDKTAEDATAIISCCVNNNYSMKNNHLGRQMIKAFQKEHPERLELYVLKETPSSFNMYLNTDFKTEGKYKCNGFSIEGKELPCYFMYRAAKEK